MTSIAQRVAARYWDPEERASVEKKDPNIPESVQEKYEEIKEEYPGEPGKAEATAWSIFCEKHKDSPHCHQEEYFKNSSMNPNDFAIELRRVAGVIDALLMPSRGLVLAALNKLLRFADEKSIAKSIRTRLWEEIRALFPGETWDMSAGPGQQGLFDTNESGKGWKSGFVSFGARPTVWSNAALIGGILFRFSYSSDAVKSAAPAEDSPEYEKWVARGGNPALKGGVAETGMLSGGYYNKTPGGSVETFSAGTDPATGQQSTEIIFGHVIFAIDEFEQVTDWQWTNPAQVRSAIQKVIDDIAAHPPSDAYSKNKQRLQKLNPYVSVKKFVNYLQRTRRGEYYKDEVALLAQAEGTVMNTILQKIPEVFKYVPTNAPFPLDTRGNI
jgi:hypothetical protein